MEKNYKSGCEPTAEFLDPCGNNINEQEEEDLPLPKSVHPDGIQN
jgi:hypothetical protein